MESNEYHFVTRWRVPATVQEVSEILRNGPDLVRWWPSVYLEAEQLRPGDETGVGAVIRLYTKGWLPYTLRWDFRVSEVRGDGFSLEACGDFVGRGNWVFRQDGPEVEIIYDWKISAEKPLLKYFSFIMKPVFSANHLWAMERGEESLRLELARRRARTVAEWARVPPPPPATFRSLPGPVPLVLAGLAGVLFVWFLASRRREA